MTQILSTKYPTASFL